MAVLLVLANSYLRAKYYLETRQRLAAGGSLSDARGFAEAAYADAIFTRDESFLACGKLVNEVVTTPLLRSWADLEAARCH